MRIAVCDDNEAQLDKVIRILSEWSLPDEVIEMEHFTSGDLLCDRHELAPFQVLFCDIEMPDINGFDVSKRMLETEPELIIVYITNHNDLIFDSLELHPTYFVRKGHLDEDMMKAIKSVMERYEQKYQKIVFEAADDNSTMVLRVDEIFYIQREKRKLMVVTKNRRIVCNGTLRHWQDNLTQCGFSVCNSGIIMNLRKISAINSMTVTMQNGDQLPISRRRVVPVKKQLLERGVLRI